MTIEELPTAVPQHRGKTHVVLAIQTRNALKDQNGCHQSPILHAEESAARSAERQMIPELHIKETIDALKGIENNMMRAACDKTIEGGEVTKGSEEVGGETLDEEEMFSQAVGQSTPWIDFIYTLNRLHSEFRNWGERAALSAHLKGKNAHHEEMMKAISSLENIERNLANRATIASVLKSKEDEVEMVSHAVRQPWVEFPKIPANPLEDQSILNCASGNLSANQISVEDELSKLLNEIEIEKLQKETIEQLSQVARMKSTRNTPVTKKSYTKGIDNVEETIERKKHVTMRFNFRHSEIGGGLLGGLHEMFKQRRGRRMRNATRTTEIGNKKNKDMPSVSKNAEKAEEPVKAEPDVRTLRFAWREETDFDSAVELLRAKRAKLIEAVSSTVDKVSLASTSEEFVETSRRLISLAECLQRMNITAQFQEMALQIDEALTAEGFSD